MMRAGALRRLTAGLLLAATVTIGTSACLLVPVPEPVVGPPAVIIAPRPYYHHRGGYYHGGYYRGGGRHWR